ncbi:uncharacterized protein BP5553_09660 [Venustampulla echinocandica]|uniref:FAD-binding PCMH-type domain-containing protein n=1 Tax=Venustampulla echinocandica TaxID=2656787 RepID=A0A370TBL9_9HELO|nr:uncharacterized protein BP5553_09660 [Venustampulla echinocandica]RDL31451.1 hypothetical protein BP5553_09660 [Venustampulla echinocandica]
MSPAQESIKDADFILPPDVDAKSFVAAMDEMRKVVGSENLEIITAAKMMPDSDGHYFNLPREHDLFYCLEKDTFLASAVIVPGSVEDVSAIVKLANKYLVPLWPISRGRNLGYGGAAPRLRGSVVLDMGGRMNKVLNIDDEHATALLEPGVSYFSLYGYLQNNGHKHLWIDSPDLGGGSVVGNALDRGAGYTPYGEHFSMHCGMEVVLPNGEIIRTGMGSLPENNTWQLFQYGYGPYPDGIFSQSNFGIVTKLGIWLMPDPGNAPTIRNTLIDAAVYAQKAEYSLSKEVLTETEVDEIAKKIGVGRWNIYGALYGPEPMRKLQWEVIRSTLMTVPGASFQFAADVEKEPKAKVLHMREETLKGIPNTYELGWLDWTCKNGSLLGFSPISPVTGADASRQYEMVKRRFHEFGFDYIGTFVVGWRELHHIVCLTFDKTDPDSRRRAHRCIELLIDDAAKLGYGEYRTHTAFMDQIASVYNWNNNSTLRFNETLKDALDPNGILAPGKSGIWPKRLRNRGFEIQRSSPTSDGASSKP